MTDPQSPLSAWSQWISRQTVRTVGSGVRETQPLPNPLDLHDPAPIQRHVPKSLLASGHEEKMKVVSM
jgi:hypothetical protein